MLNKKVVKEKKEHEKNKNNTHSHCCNSNIFIDMLQRVSIISSSFFPSTVFIGKILTSDSIGFILFHAGTRSIADYSKTS
jgi:hypothetical protein